MPKKKEIGLDALSKLRDNLPEGDPSIDIDKIVNKKPDIKNKEWIINQGTCPNNRRAKAPYNFIPINNFVINSDFNFKNCNLNLYHFNRNSGYINVDIITKTNIFTRKSKIEDKEKLKSIQKELSDLSKKYQNEKNATKKEDLKKKILEKLNKISKGSSDFNSLNNKPCISGSTIRGLIRNIIENVTFGKFIDFQDKRLYFRGLADTTRLKNEYVKNMVVEGSFNTYKFKAGILEKDGINKYVIYPCKNVFRVKSEYINGNHIIINSGETPIKIGDSDIKQVFYCLNDVNKTIAGIRQIESDTYNLPGYLISSGKFNDRANQSLKKNQWLVDKPAKNEKLSIPYQVVREYLEDSNRQSKNLIFNADKKFKKKDYNNLDPNDVNICFFVTKYDKDGKEEVASFGSNGFFRLAYKLKLSDHLPEQLLNKNITDLAEAIFGKLDSHSSRVFFEEVKSNKLITEVSAAENFYKILSKPSPTSFQHYLTQGKCSPGDMKHYNDNNVALRGYKMYWHDSEKKWEELNDDFICRHSTQFMKKIKPIIKDTQFSGCIRFENLTDIELGALLFAIDLPEKLCHKIGMGKPLGLGSIRITPKLHLSNRVDRYKKLNNEWSQNLPESNGNGKSITDFKNKFADYILEKLGRKFDKNNKELWLELWKEERLQQLQAMLYFETKLAESETSYMALGEFKNRKILPKPSDVNPNGVIIK